MRLLLAATMAVLALVASAYAQLQFCATLSGTNEVPPNSDPTVCTGTFSLVGSNLNFYVDVPAVTFIAQNAYIQGPAGAGTNAPIIFDLGGPVFQGGSPQFGIPPSYVFFSPYTPPFGAGPFPLTDAQISDLEGGLWYVNVTSAQQPDGQLRGQIFQVPEPGTFALLLFSGTTLWFLRRRRQIVKVVLLVVALF